MCLSLNFLSDPGSLLPFYGRTYLYGIGGHPMLGLDETAGHLALPRATVARLHNLALKSLRNAVVSAWNLFGCAA